jgi:hypothetical protein
MCRGARRPIIDADHEMSVRDENILLDEIQDLLREPAAGHPLPSLVQLEDTLTAGYARALALEAERSRLERRVADVAKRIGGDETAQQAEQLVSLTRRIARADARLARLRPVLLALRRRAAEVRAASVSAA